VVSEIAADGRWVAALVGPTCDRCAFPPTAADTDAGGQLKLGDGSADRVVAWKPGTGSVARIRAPYSVDGWVFDLQLERTAVSWEHYHCGMYCYLNPFSADIRQPDKVKGSLYDDDIVPEDSDQPRTPSPPAETHRGVALTVRAGVILLHRRSDGATRRIAAPDGVVDAELENSGLFYAYNARGSRQPGRLVFVPFEALF
jgi:hypothetical protein